MPALPWVIGLLATGALLGGQLDDALESLNPFAGDDKGLTVARVGVLGLAGLGAFTVWRKIR